MIKNILIAVDGSQHSIKGVELGAAIAQNTDAKVLLLHVVKPNSLPEGFKDFAEVEHISVRDADILQRAGDFLMADAKDVAQKAGLGNNLETDIVEGPIAKSIAARALSMGADLIVVGSRGLGAIEGALRGGVSHRVEMLAKGPVLIAK